MPGLIVFVVVMVAVIGLLWFAWTRRATALGRGIGAAGAAYNGMHGFAEPEPTTSGTVAGSSAPPVPGNDPGR